MKFFSVVICVFFFCSFGVSLEAQSTKKKVITTTPAQTPEFIETFQASSYSNEDLNGIVLKGFRTGDNVRLEIYNPKTKKIKNLGSYSDPKNEIRFEKNTRISMDKYDYLWMGFRKVFIKGEEFYYFIRVRIDEVSTVKTLILK